MLQRTAGNAAVARLVADQRSEGAPPPGGGARLLLRDDDKRTGPFNVVPPMQEADKTRRWYDPVDKTTKPVWTPEGGYARNPSAQPLRTLIKNNKVSGGFENGTFMYVIDQNGEVIIAKRMGEPGGAAGRATGMPHPTLIGGKDPRVLSAGEIEMRAGRIYRIDNQSGHFQPTRKSMAASVKAFMKLPANTFHPEFKAESVHYQGEVRTTKPFRSLQTLKLRAKDLKAALRGLKPRALYGKMKSQKFRTGVKEVGKSLIGLLVIIALQYVVGKLMEKIAADFIDKQVENLQPDIEKALEDKSDELEDLIEEDPDADIYVNVQLVVGVGHTKWVDPEMMDVVDMDTLPAVWLSKVGYSRQPWDDTPQTVHSEACLGTASDDKTYVTSSYPISPMDFFKDDAATPTGDQQPAVK